MKFSKIVIMGLVVLTFLAVPVAAAYDSYFYEWNSGVACKTQLPNNGLAGVYDFGFGHTTYLNKAPARYPYLTKATIDCPYQTLASYTGKHPVIQYGSIQYTTKSPDAKIVGLTFFSGMIHLKDLPADAYSTNGETKELNWDLGAHYDFGRGMTIEILIQNQNTADTQYVTIAGYGARADWNSIP